MNVEIGISELRFQWSKAELDFIFMRSCAEVVMILSFNAFVVYTTQSGSRIEVQTHEV